MSLPPPGRNAGKATGTAFGAALGQALGIEPGSRLPGRPSGRAPDQLRALKLEPGFARHAEGSCLVRMGVTEVLCTASVEGRVPAFMRGKGQGWVTAEYGMLPRATHTRGEREAARGKQSGRTQEIQRLIGRSLRAVTDRAAMGEMTITLDCDVLTADGGTRCAAITGAWVALHLAFQHLPPQQHPRARPAGRPGGRRLLRHLRRPAGARPRLRRGQRGRARTATSSSPARAASWRCRPPRRARPSPRRSWRGLLGLARKGTAELFAAQRAAVGRERGAPTAAEERLLLATHNAGKAREVAALLAGHGIDVVTAGDARPAGAGGDRDELHRQRLAQGPRRGAGGGHGRRWPTIQRLLRRRPGRGAGGLHRGLGGAAGRHAGLRRGHGARWSGSRGTPRIAAPGSPARWRSPGRTGMSRPSSARRHGAWVWPPRGETRLRLRPDVRAGGGDADLRRRWSPRRKHAISHRAAAFRLLSAACLPAG